MADEVDITADRAEKEASMLRAASVKPVGPEANGSCHWCGTRLPMPMRWCDAECRSDHAENQRLLKLRGKS